MTVTPGVGMLASSSGNTRPNVWAKIPEVDEANLPRYKSPLAGSFTLHKFVVYEGRRRPLLGNESTELSTGERTNNRYDTYYSEMPAGTLT